MNPSLDHLNQTGKEFESFLKNYLEMRKPLFQYTGLSDLKKSIEYTLFSPCKRFRPAISFGVCEALNLPYQEAFPLSSALEFVHTASLIHDDLPCMDNDSQRRGKKSNHIVFDENMALIAGDALLIEAFYLLSHYKQKNSVIKCVAQATSMRGMIGGQSLDLRVLKTPTLEFLKILYKMKTGALIQASVEGVLFLNDQVCKKTRQSFLEFSEYLGLAFQLADDLQSKDPNEPLFQMMNEKKARVLLQEWSQKSLDALEGFSAQSLVQLVRLNQLRVE